MPRTTPIIALTLLLAACGDTIYQPATVTPGDCAGCEPATGLSGAPAAEPGVEVAPPAPEEDPTCDARELIEVGRLDLAEEGGLIWDVDVRGDRAYVTHQRGVRVVDVSEPTAPALLGGTEHANARGFALGDGGRFGALAVLGDGLRVIDVDAPSPREVGAYDLTGAAGAEYANDLKRVGDVAYVAAFSQGLWAIDVSNPERPSPLGHCCGLSGHPIRGASGVDVVGEFAVVADTEAGLRVVSVADPSRLIAVALLPLEGEAQVIRVVDQLAWVALSDAALAVVDLSRPNDPRLRDSVLLPGPPQALTVARGLVYVAAGEGGLLAIEPDTLEVTPLADAERAVSAVAVTEGAIYVGDGEVLRVLEETCVGE